MTGEEIYSVEIGSYTEAIVGWNWKVVAVIRFGLKCVSQELGKGQTDEKMNILSRENGYEGLCS